ncbi:MAG: ParB/RepB/Spo0J family partition protein [Armatimonadetes bacterium]|nr:ParB/RepB/Spo0J family partition protein [Armatimonadota bacterium]
MEKKGLGRGLGALIPMADKEVQPGTISEVDISKVSVNPYQPRNEYSDEKFQELVNSVRVHGILQPIVIRSKGDGDYELVAGERRLRAAKAAGLARIPSVVRELTNEQSLEVALVENIQREDINAIDAALAYKRLSEEFGLSQESLAFAVGKSRSAIANTMRLLSLPEPVKSELKRGRIGEGHARAILSIDGEPERIELCKRITGAGLSVREAERLAREWNRGEASRGTENVSRETFLDEQDPNLLEAEAQLRRLFGTKVSIIQTKDRGRIVMEYYSDDDLERLLIMLCGR